MPRTAAGQSHGALSGSGGQLEGPYFKHWTVWGLGPRRVSSIRACRVLASPCLLATFTWLSKKKPNLSLPSVCVVALYPVHGCGEAGLTEGWLPQTDKGKLISPPSQ